MYLVNRRNLHLASAEYDPSSNHAILSIIGPSLPHLGGLVTEQRSISDLQTYTSVIPDEYTFIIGPAMSYWILTTAGNFILCMYVMLSQEWHKSACVTMLIYEKIKV